MSFIETATAMYLKEKGSLDNKVAKDIGAWRDQSSMNGMLSSGIFINGIWEREEERTRQLCRFYWGTAIELALKQNGTLETKDMERIRVSAKEIIDAELGQAKKLTFDWIRKAGLGLDSHFEKKYEEASQNYHDDLEREFTIRAGLAAIQGIKSTPGELPSSTLIEKDFAFVTDEDLRNICKRDYEEVQRVQIAGAHKATILLSGSLTEALLLDALKRNEAKATASSKASSKPLTQWDLHNLLDVAIDLGLINPGAAVLAKGIKDYRNLIHPGKEIRTKFHVGSEEATISRQFLELVIRDLSGKSSNG
jgi:hypothetical protein